MTELRVYLLLEDLQRQFAAYMGTPLRVQRVKIRGALPSSARPKSERDAQ